MWRLPAPWPACRNGGSVDVGDFSEKTDKSPDQRALAEIWERILSRLSGIVNSQAFHTWFKPTRLIDYSDGVLVIEGPNQFFIDWLHEHHMDKIEDAAREELAGTARIELTSRPNPSRVSPPEKSPGRSMIVREPVILPNKIHLNRNYTFDEFIVGDCNRLAHAGALAAAERPARVYNPLFIYGGSGLGKTHLLQAIGHHVLAEHPGMSISYVSTENFVNEFISAIQKTNTLEFKQRYRNVDILLIDDIQFLAGKERMQEEFFHTFNELHGKNKQIVCTSDRPPKEIPTLEERLRSRFAWGLITDLHPPDIETRIAILQKKVEDEHIQIPRNVIEVIAENVTDNIRELEGSLIRILAFASLTCQEITVSMAQNVLKDLITGPRKRPINASFIKKVVSEYFDVPVDTLKARTRITRVVRARQIAMFLCRELTSLSLVQIGEKFGGRDHATVLYSVRKVRGLVEKDRELASRLDEIKDRLTRN